jgi:hypothetical protein
MENIIELLEVEKHKLIEQKRRIKSYMNDPEIMQSIPFNVYGEVVELSKKVDNFDKAILILNNLPQSNKVR